MRNYPYRRRNKTHCVASVEDVGSALNRLLSLVAAIENSGSGAIELLDDALEDMDADTAAFLERDPQVLAELADIGKELRSVRRAHLRAMRRLKSLLYGIRRSQRPY
jgi:hypothetical protein